MMFKNRNNVKLPDLINVLFAKEGSQMGADFANMKGSIQESSLMPANSVTELSQTAAIYSDMSESILESNLSNVHFVEGLLHKAAL